MECCASRGFSRPYRDPTGRQIIHRSQIQQGGSRIAIMLVYGQYTGRKMSIRHIIVTIIYLVTVTPTDAGEACRYKNKDKNLLS